MNCTPKIYILISWNIKIMSIGNDNLGKIFKVITFFLLVSLILISSLVVNWHFSAEIIALVLLLIAYTLLLTLPITKFKLSPTGFEGELERLMKEREASPAPPETVEEVNEEVAEFSQDLGEPDTILMRLSIEIETTLRTIAESAGLSKPKVGIGQLTRMLQQKQIITDSWLINALHFFRKYRNKLLHEGKTSNIQEAISVGREVLAKLRQIQKER